MKTLDASPLGGAVTVPGRLFRAAIPDSGWITSPFAERGCRLNRDYLQNDNTIENCKSIIK
jgi:hypothetical protein